MLWRRRRPDEDIAEELRAHAELEASELREEGATPAEAARTARLALGNATAIQERLFEAHRWLWWDRTWRDLRHGFRSLRRNPSYSLAAVFTLALGIGANTAIFSVFRAVLLDALPYPEPSRIVVLEPSNKKTGAKGTVVSAPDFHDFRTRNRSLAALAYHTGGETTAVVEGSAHFAQAQLATPDFFRVFGIAPSAGRFWNPDEDRAQVAVLSHRWAVERFGDASAALGRTVKAANHSLRVIGVAAPGFSYPGKSEVWLPAGLFEENRFRSGHNYFAVARLANGVSLAEARRDLEQVADQLAAQYPENRDKSVAVTPLAEKLSGPSAPTLWLLMGSALCVLLIACANVAGLQLAHQAGRAREIAVRVAMGAGRGRVIRQLLTESVLLSVIGSALGIALGWALLKAVLATAPGGIPSLERAGMDSGVLLFSLALSVACGVIFGLGPARLSSRADFTAGLRESASKGAIAGVGQRLRTALIATEIAISVVLVAAAGSLGRSLYDLTRADLGFAADRLLLVDTAVSTNDETAARRATLRFAELLARVESLPGVRGTAGFRTQPFAGRRSTVSYWIEGGPRHRLEEAPVAQAQVVTPRYFETMGIPIRAGRDVSDADKFGFPQVAVINQSFARRAFGSGNPLGKRIRCGFSRQSGDGMEIVGVVADARQTAPGEAAKPEMFVPAQQHPSPGANLTMAVKTDLEPYALSSALRETIGQMDPELPVRFSTMNEVVYESRAYPRFRGRLVGFFSILALGLSAVGVYGLISYLAARRTSEIGLRLALGAGPATVFRLVFGESFRIVAAGLAVGAGAAIALGKVLEAKLPLFALQPRDPSMLVAAVAVIALISGLAALIPAMRAAAADPLAALRSD